MGNRSATSVSRSAMALMVAAFACRLLGVPATAAVFDLQSDWNEPNNPNGPWTLRDGDNVMPFLADYTFWSNFDSAYNPPSGHISQPTFIYGDVPGNINPSWFKAAVTPAGDAVHTYDWLVGDIVAHTTDNFNGAGRGDPNVLWTTPSAGTAHIYGNVWDGRTSLNRPDAWELWVTQGLVTTLFASGNLAGNNTDSVSRATPALFDFTNVALAEDDTVMLKFYRTGEVGDFIGFNLTVDFVSAVPEPATLALLAFGLAGLGFSPRRKH